MGCLDVTQVGPKFVSGWPEWQHAMQAPDHCAIAPGPISPIVTNKIIPTQIRGMDGVWGAEI